MTISAKKKIGYEAVIESSLDADSKYTAHNLIMKFSASMTLKAALKLGIPDILAAAEGKKPLSAAEILAQLPTKSTPGPHSITNVRRLLFPLVREGFVSESFNDNKEPVYGLTEVSKWFVKGSAMNMLSIADMHWDPATHAAWDNLSEVILDETVTPFDKANGLPVHEYISTKGTELGTHFQGAMVSYTMWQLEGVLNNLWKCGVLDGVNTLVDVGGSQGTLISEIVAHDPRIHGINFDLPHVIATAPSVNGVKHVPGSFFDDVPSGDAMILKFIIHNYGEEDSIQILKNCYKALPKNGKVIVAEYFQNALDQSSQAVFVNDLDLSMLLLLKGAKERTKEEYQGLLNAAGFERSSVIQNPGALDLIVAYKESNW